jgi:hypothetical protein
VLPKPPPNPPKPPALDFSPTVTAVSSDIRVRSKVVTFESIPEELQSETSEMSVSEISQMYHESVLNGFSGDEGSFRRVVNIKLLESDRLRKIKFEPSTDVLRIVTRCTEGRDSSVCQKVSRKDVLKFSCSKKMSDSEENGTAGEPDQVFNRVSNWISTHDFRPHDEQGVETNIVDGITDITSVTKNIERGRKGAPTDGLVVEERTDEVKCGDGGGSDKSEGLIKTLTKFSQYSPFEKRRNRTASPSHFSVIVEGEELVCSFLNIILCLILVLYFILSLYFYEFTIGYLFCPY